MMRLADGQKLVNFTKAKKAEENEDQKEAEEIEAIEVTEEVNLDVTETESPEAEE
jgi:hypothetical protein